jgi:hypothetical protein
MRISKKFAGKCIGKLVYTHTKANNPTKNTDEVIPSRVEWTYKNNGHTKTKSETSDKTSDATYTSNEDRSHASSDDDKSVNPVINSSSSIVGYFYPFEEEKNPPSYLLSMIPKIPSMNTFGSKQNLADNRSATPTFTDRIKAKSDEKDNLDYYMDYLETETEGDIYYESIQKPPNSCKESDTSMLVASRPSSSIGKDKEDWLETLNMFCSNSMENIAGLFRS